MAATCSAQFWLAAESTKKVSPKWHEPDDVPHLRRAVLFRLRKHFPKTLAAAFALLPTGCATLPEGIEPVDDFDG
ncbi:MAG: hypothetical protein ACI9UA_005733 [Pseudoalteromonas tetraodonis]|jgi:hypothetical protein